MVQKISAPKELAFTFEVVRVKGVNIPKNINISFSSLNLGIKLFFFYLKISFISNMSIEI